MFVADFRSFGFQKLPGALVGKVSVRGVRSLVGGVLVVPTWAPFKQTISGKLFFTFATHFRACAERPRPAFFFQTDQNLMASLVPFLSFLPVVSFHPHVVHVLNLIFSA